MSETIEVIFDGQVLRPTAPPNLPLNTPLRVTVETPALQKTQDTSADPYAYLKVLVDANADGPEDWSANVDKYLYGPMLPKDEP
jgi:hypothetical protein